MKQLIFVNGTMGVGKSATCRALSKQLRNSVFLDGDWCWDMHPFIVNEETKAMVMDNITHVLQNFLQCSVYEYVIFGWVMHEQAILDDVLAHLCLTNTQVHVFSLVCDESTLRKRIEGDIAQGKRTSDVLERSLTRMGAYNDMNTICIDTSHNTIQEVVDRILTYTKENNGLQ